MWIKEWRNVKENRIRGRYNGWTKRARLYNDKVEIEDHEGKVVIPCDTRENADQIYESFKAGKITTRSFRK